MDYATAKREAQARADETGMDYGVEKLGSEHRYFGLPRRENRFGFELRCEVVSCTRLERCVPGHGPVVQRRPKGRVRVQDGRVFLDGRPIGRVEQTSEGWGYSAGKPYLYPAASYWRAVSQCVHSYASWIGWYAVIVDRSY